MPNWRHGGIKANVLRMKGVLFLLLEKSNRIHMNKDISLMGSDPTICIIGMELKNEKRN